MSVKLEKNPELEEKVRAWLESKKSLSTRSVYKADFKSYQIFAGKSALELKYEIDEEFKASNRKGTIERRLKAFFQRLTKAKGLSETLGVTYVGAIMSFYRFYSYNYRVNTHITSLLKLVNYTKTLRDRAIILTLAQSGMDVSTLRSLKVRDVWKGLEEGEVPLRLCLIRRKENVEYETFPYPVEVKNFYPLVPIFGVHCPWN